MGDFKMRCQECGKILTNEEDCYGHDCEVGLVKKKAKQKTQIEYLKNPKNKKKSGAYANMVRKELSPDYQKQLDVLLNIPKETGVWN